MYAITGVTGHTGSVVAETLLAQGKQVRVVVRDAAKGEPWAKRGAEVAVASFGDTAALTRAFTGTQGVYVLLPPNPTSHDPLGDNAKLTASIAAAVRDAGVPHVVLLSSVGAQHADGTGPIRALHVAERELAATGAALTAVRAAYFQENWGASLATLDTGTIYSFVPTDLRFPQVATVDIGRTAAAALAEGTPAARTQIIELAGPRELSGEEVAQALGAIVGTPVAIQASPLDAVVPTFTKFGLSTEMAELYREMYAGIISGRVDWERGAARSVRGSASIEDTLKKLLGR